MKRFAQRLLAIAGYSHWYTYFTTASLFMSLYITAREGVDVVHAHNPPDTLVVVSAAIEVFGKKLVFDHHDLSPELFQSRYNAGDSLVTWALRVFERLSVRLADVVIATNESYRAIDIARNKADPARVFIVRNGPDLGRVRLVEPDPHLRSMNKTILVYLGAMNPQDGVGYYLLRALSHLVHRSPYGILLCDYRRRRFQDWS